MQPPSPSKRRPRGSQSTSPTSLPVLSASQPKATKSPPYKLPPPAATTALEAVHELQLVVQSFSDGQLNRARKTELSPFLDAIETLIICESAVAAPAPDTPPMHTGANAPVAVAPTDSPSLQASITMCTQRALESFTRSIEETIKTSIAAALRTTSPATLSAVPPPAVPRPQPPPNDMKHLDVVIGIPRASATPAFTKLTTAQLKCAVEAAVEKSCIAGLTGTKIHGVRRLSNGNVQVRAHSSEQAAMLLKHSEEWVPHVVAGASISRKHFMLIAASVPIAFDPTAPDAREVLRGENPNAITRAESILKMRWLHGACDSTSTKREASLVLTVANADTADRLIAHTLSVYGALCPVRKFVPPPQQCYHCQKYGHLAQACSNASNSRSPTCARCAGPHALKDCSCPAKTKCTDMRRCHHVQPRCANCQGPHKSFDSACPHRAFEQSVVAARLDNGSSYFNPSFKPFPLSSARTSGAGTRV